jgi:hypothetical protein
VLETHRYLGLELSGAKNPKTALAAIQYYPKEKKIFLLDIYDRIAGHDDQSGDDALLDLIGEVSDGVSKIGVNVPLELPPCLNCPKKQCQGVNCSNPATRWMREMIKKASRSSPIRVKDFTPYTQRPIELWIRYQVLPHLPHGAHFEVDETLGGNKAPLTARMNYLKRHLKKLTLIEAWPKLTIALLAKDLGLDRRTLANYRNLDEGAHQRVKILEAMAEKRGIFIYERDLKKLSQSLPAFDAFVCAYTALLSDLGQTAKVPRGFPQSTGWVAYPE